MAMSTLDEKYSRDHCQVDGQDSFTLIPPAMLRKTSFWAILKPARFQHYQKHVQTSQIETRTGTLRAYHKLPNLPMPALRWKGRTPSMAEGNRHSAQAGNDFERAIIPDGLLTLRRPLCCISKTPNSAVLPKRF